METVIKDLFDVDPMCVALQMRDANGKSYTSYWNCSQDDRAVMMDAMREDWLFNFLQNNREEIREILESDDDEEEGDEEDGLCETDTGADSEG